MRRPVERYGASSTIASWTTQRRRSATGAILAGGSARADPAAAATVANIAIGIDARSTGTRGLCGWAARHALVGHAQIRGRARRRAVATVTAIRRNAGPAAAAETRGTSAHFVHAYLPVPTRRRAVATVTAVRRNAGPAAAEPTRGTGARLRRATGRPAATAGARCVSCSHGSALASGATVIASARNSGGARGPTSGAARDISTTPSGRAPLPGAGRASRPPISVGGRISRCLAAATGVRAKRHGGEKRDQCGKHAHGRILCPADTGRVARSGGGGTREAPGLTAPARTREEAAHLHRGRPQTEPPGLSFSGRITPWGRGRCRKEFGDDDSRESGSRG